MQSAMKWRGMGILFWLHFLWMYSSLLKKTSLHRSMPNRIKICCFKIFVINTLTHYAVSSRALKLRGRDNMLNQYIYNLCFQLWNYLFSSVLSCFKRFHQWLLHKQLRLFAVVANKEAKAPMTDQSSPLIHIPSLLPPKMLRYHLDAQLQLGKILYKYSAQTCPVVNI